MNNIIVLDFKNIISELEQKEIKLCFLENRGIFLEDTKGNLYQMDSYWCNSYLDKLIKNSVKVKFNLVDITLSKNVGNWEKELWGVLEVKDFIKRHSLQDI